MSHVLHWFKEEFLKVLPAVIFFLLAFNLICLTEALMMHKSGVRYTSFLGATTGALVAGKVLLVMDLLPFIVLLRNKPLLYVVLWKTALYSLGSLAFRVIEQVVHHAWKEGSLSVGFTHFVNEVEWPRFLAIQIWITAILLIFVASKELILAVGPARVRQLFIGR